MADAMETARQIAKTHDDCLCEGADTATLVSRIEAHVLAYAADVQRQGDLIASMDDAAMDKMQAMMGQVAEQRDIALAYGAERERLRESAERDLCRWRAAIQEITPGGSEFMDPVAVRQWAAMLKRETCEAKLAKAKAERALAEVDAALYTTRYAIGHGGNRTTCMSAVDYSRAANEACKRHRARSSSPAQDEGKPTT